MSFGPIIKFKVGDLQLELAPIEKEDAAEFINIKHGGGMQRYSVSRYLARTAAPVLEDEYEWFESVRTAKDKVIWGIWLLGDESESRTLIGNSALFDIGKIGHTSLISHAESGSLIFRPEYWGKGIASAAHKVRAWYAFEYLGIHRIQSSVIRENKGSSTAIGRSGYVYTHTSRNDVYSEGELHHSDNFECLNPLDSFWRQWWNGDTPPRVYKEARKTTLEAISWAKENAQIL